MIENMTSHISPMLNCLQQQRSIQGFAQNVSYDSNIDDFIKEGLI